MFRLPIRAIFALALLFAFSAALHASPTPVLLGSVSTTLSGPDTDFSGPIQVFYEDCNSLPVCSPVNIYTPSFTISATTDQFFTVTSGDLNFASVAGDASVSPPFGPSYLGTIGYNTTSSGFSISTRSLEFVLPGATITSFVFDVGPSALNSTPDRSFLVTVNAYGTPPVPEPPSGLLMASGLLLLAFVFFVRGGRRIVA